VAAGLSAATFRVWVPAVVGLRKVISLAVKVYWECGGKSAVCVVVSFVRYSFGVLTLCCVPFEATVSAKISMGQWFACEQACVISGSEREQRSGLREFEVLPKAIFNRTFVVFKNISNPLIS
jgi:hypothetical protein